LNKEAAEDFFKRIKEYAFAEQESTAAVPAPGCTQQAPINPIYGAGGPTLYQHTFEQGG
jgi:hypothetical protein